MQGLWIVTKIELPLRMKYNILLKYTYIPRAQEELSFDTIN